MTHVCGDSPNHKMKPYTYLQIFKTDLIMVDLKLI